MIDGVKKCIDAGDIKGLRYIFLDSLDVDPTFEKYKDDFDVCRNLNGMFESYSELTKLSGVKEEWDMDYWVKLKIDQKSNFSKERFEHMKEVAKVVHAEKIERLLIERAAKQLKIDETNKQAIPKSTINTVPKLGSITHSVILDRDKNRIDERRQEIELDNQKIEQEKNLREAKRKEIERENASIDKNQPKKSLGIVTVIAVIIMIVVVVLLSKVL